MEVAVIFFLVCAGIALVVMALARLVEALQ